MKVGFTGTRHGMTAKQRLAVKAWLQRLAIVHRDSEFHHGCCIGADMEAHAFARGPYRVVGYPSTAQTRTRADIDATDFEILHVAKPPLDRNMDIVDACDVLIAAPRQRAEEQRSGTWHAIRYARKVGRTTVMVWP